MALAVRFCLATKLPAFDLTRNFMSRHILPQRSMKSKGEQLKTGMMT